MGRKVKAVDEVSERRIVIEFLKGNLADEGAGVDLEASAAAYGEAVTADVAAEFPGYEVEVTAGEGRGYQAGARVLVPGGYDPIAARRVDAIAAAVFGARERWEVRAGQ